MRIKSCLSLLLRFGVGAGGADEKESQRSNDFHFHVPPPLCEQVSSPLYAQRLSAEGASTVTAPQPFCPKIQTPRARSPVLIRQCSHTGMKFCWERRSAATSSEGEYRATALGIAQVPNGINPHRSPDGQRRGDYCQAGQSRGGDQESRDVPRRDAEHKRLHPSRGRPGS
jgi:hypothetical protein